MTVKQINVVLKAEVSIDQDVQKKVDNALQALYCITYDELTDDIWQAIKLLQKVKQPK
ncbi:hypothetical protein RMB13_20670 [Acinetobacter sp. V102_4]|uniref:hypothetical protein n=1 Tax=Acinetobacter sp. V102_4 TaxID=3072984 RepID=UPI00287E9762|nr:hypothetical protein [Acinetobacter sp. V102_4]MDS7931853.1 hypothetical protein [Acinetobacter sp. V102_4]